MRTRETGAVAVLGLLSALLCHCSSSIGRDEQQPVLTMSVSHDVATTAEIFARVSLDCPSGSLGRCERATVDPIVDVASVDDPSILQPQPRRENEKSVLRLKALREGTVTLKLTGATFDGSERKEFTETIRVSTPDRLTVDPPHNCQQPIIVGIGSELRVPTQLWRGPVSLDGDPFPYPIKSDVATLKPDAVIRGNVTMVAQAKRGVGAIQSTYSETDTLPIEVVDVDQVTSIELTPPPGAEMLAGRPLIQRGQTITLGAKLLVGTRSLCQEDLEKQVTSNTPTVCTGSSTRSGVRVETPGTGTCTLIVRVGATAESSMVFEIRDTKRGT